MKKIILSTVKKQGIQHVVQFLADTNFQPKKLSSNIFLWRYHCFIKEWIPTGKGGLQLQIDGFFLRGGGELLNGKNL